MVSKSKITVRYAETDKMGIVHHSVYPIWYEVARTDLSKATGFSYSDMEQAGIMTPLISLECKFLSPAYYDDELTITCTVIKLSPVKIQFYYEVFKNDFKSPINTGTTTHAIVNKDMKPINSKKIYPNIYAILEKMAN